MESQNYSVANQFNSDLNDGLSQDRENNDHDCGDRCFQIAKNLASKLQFDQALNYCGLAIEHNPQKTIYADFYQKLCQSRSKVYKPSLDFAIANFSYQLWSRYNTPKLLDLRKLCEQLPAIANRPKISIIVAGKISQPQQLTKIICSAQEQVYPHWELLLPEYIHQLYEQNSLTDKNERSQFEFLRQEDQRLKTIAQTQDHQQLDLFTKAIAAATGSWIAIIKAETILTPITLLEFIKQLQQDSALDLAYGDEDQINEDNCLEKPWFKPRWSPELFLARNYFNSLSFIRREMVTELAADLSLDIESEIDYDYSYDLLLRLTEKTNKIAHISQILSHTQQQSQQKQINNNRLIQKTLQRRGEIATVTTHSSFPHIQNIRYQLSKNPLISIIIPTKNLGRLLDECLSSIFTLSTYANYEVILIDNGSDDLEALAVIRKWQQLKPEQCRAFNYNQPFNYSQINNFGVRQAQGDYLLFLNNDTKVITSDWLEAMLEQAQREQIGAVGAMLLYPNNTIQHAGVILGVTGIAGHSHRHDQLGSEGYYQYLLTTNNVAAVTGACLMCRRDRFEAVDGFNEQLAVAYNDVDFCLKLHQQGYQNLWLSHVQLYHYESQTRTPENTPAKQRRIQQEVDYMQIQWGELIAQDPFYNKHLTREKEDFSLDVVYQFKIEAILLVPLNQAQFIGYFIDQPQIGRQSSQYLEIVGWVIGKLAKAVALEISCYGHLLTKISVCQPRPDVAAVFASEPTAAKSGFAATIDLSQIELDNLIANSMTPSLQIELTVVLADKKQILIATIELTC